MCVSEKCVKSLNKTQIYKFNEFISLNMGE